MRRLVALLVCGAAAAQSTWTVAASGSADFPSLVAAVAAPQVVDGDTLLVEPGTYTNFITSKALHLIGRSGGAMPYVLYESRFDGSAWVTIAGMSFEELLCRQVPGRVVIEGCDIGQTGTTSFGVSDDTFLIEDCAEVVVSNGSLQGKTGDDYYVESPGLTVHDSTVALVNCAIKGGKGGKSMFGYPGQPGIRIEAGSVVTVAGCTVTGGSGGNGLEFCQSEGAPGIETLGSVLQLRGDSNDLISGGYTCPVGPTFALDGNNATVTWSGVVLMPPQIAGGMLFNSTVMHASPAEPFLWIGGNPAPGGTRRLNVAGPNGAPALLWFSLQPLLASSPKLVGGPLWLNPGAPLLIVPLSLFGQDLPVNVNLPLPADASLAGITAWVQGFLPQGDGHYFATNPASIVFRF